MTLKTNVKKKKYKDFFPINIIPSDFQTEHILACCKTRFLFPCPALNKFRKLLLRLLERDRYHLIERFLFFNCVVCVCG